MENLRALALALLSASMFITGCRTKPVEFKELVPEKAEEIEKLARESPLNITVTIDREHRIFLNKEEVGTVKDVSLLKERLAQALERRKQYYRASAENRPPDDTYESGQGVVFVCAPSSFTYGEVVKVIEAIKAVGGGPIGVGDCNPAQ